MPAYTDEEIRNMKKITFNHNDNIHMRQELLHGRNWFYRKEHRGNWQKRGTNCANQESNYKSDRFVVLGELRVHCLKCGAKWKIGNVTPNIERCPICNTAFRDDSEYRGYDSIAEFLMCLIQEEGENICLNTLQITSYLNDFYPGETVLRGQIEKLLNNGIGVYVYKCRKDNDLGQDLKTIVNQSGMNDLYDSIEKTVSFLTVENIEEGSNIEQASFYLDQVDQLHRTKFKLIALEKANKLSKDTHLLKREADLLLEVGDNNKARSLILIEQKQ